MERKVKKVDLEQLLADGHTVQLHPQGYSMYPLFVPGRDEAVIAPVSPDDRRVRRGAVALYRREGSILVLHRIWRVGRDGVYFVGDNQVEVEGPLPRAQIRGILVGIIRNGKTISVKNPGYLLYAHGWLLLRPFRNVLKKIIHFARKKGKILSNSRKI